MSTYTPSNVDTDQSNLLKLLSKSGMAATPTPPTSDILGILQREQERAISLLSLNPSLSSLFTSCANRAAVLEPTSATPSVESGGWKAVQTGITSLREESEKLELENREVVRRLETAEASQEASRSQITSLKFINANQQNEINALRRELLEARDLQDRLMTDFNTERGVHYIRVSDLEAQRVELRRTIAGQQAKISQLESQLPQDYKPIVSNRHPASLLTPIGGLPTPNESTHHSPILPLQTLSPEACDSIASLSPVSISTLEEVEPTYPPGLDRKVEPQLKA